MDKFTSAYAQCALWSSTDEHERPLDDGYSIEDFTPEALAKIEADCKAFREANAELLAQAYERYSCRDWSHDEQAGHDFWLTRNHHGVGFWDRGLGDVGQKLTQAAHACGECNLYIDDDGKVGIA